MQDRIKIYFIFLKVIKCLFYEIFKTFHFFKHRSANLCSDTVDIKMIEYTIIDDMVYIKLSTILFPTLCDLIQVIRFFRWKISLKVLWVLNLINSVSHCWCDFGNTIIVVPYTIFTIYSKELLASCQVCNIIEYAL